MSSILEPFAAAFAALWASCKARLSALVVFSFSGFKLDCSSFCLSTTAFPLFSAILLQILRKEQIVQYTFKTKKKKKKGHTERFHMINRKQRLSNLRNEPAFKSCLKRCTLTTSSSTGTSKFLNQIVNPGNWQQNNSFDKMVKTKT
jgi:hypothetical protein